MHNEAGDVYEWAGLGIANLDPKYIPQTITLTLDSVKRLCYVENPNFNFWRCFLTW